MIFTQEQIEKMKAAKTAEELIALAKAEGIEATEEEITAQFKAMHKEGEIADEELDNVAGGCGDPDPVFSVGSKVAIGLQSFKVVEILEYTEYRGYKYKCLTLEGPDTGVVYTFFESQLNQ